MSDLDRAEFERIRKAYRKASRLKIDWKKSLADWRFYVVMPYVLALFAALSPLQIIVWVIDGIEWASGKLWHVRYYLKNDLKLDFLMAPIRWMGDKQEAENVPTKN